MAKAEVSGENPGLKTRLALDTYTRLVKEKGRKERGGATFVVGDDSEKVISVDYLKNPVGVFTSIRDRNPTHIDEKTQTEHFPTTKIGAAVVGEEVVFFKDVTEATRPVGSKKPPQREMTPLQGYTFGDPQGPQEADFREAIDLLRRATKQDQVVYPTPGEEGVPLKETK